jgi:hypothetical protein
MNFCLKDRTLRVKGTTLFFCLTVLRFFDGDEILSRAKRRASQYKCIYVHSHGRCMSATRCSNCFFFKLMWENWTLVSWILYTYYDECVSRHILMVWVIDMMGKSIEKQADLLFIEKISSICCGHLERIGCRSREIEWILNFEYCTRIQVPPPWG